MKTLIIIGSILVCLFIFYKVYQQVNIDKGLEQLIGNGAVILDVRTAKEFERGHIKGAVNVSLGNLRKEHLPLDTSTVYITCCSHGLRSIKAVDILKERGFKKVYNGGAWTDLEELTTGGVYKP